MRVRADWSRTFEFACHSASCAPPPAGRGGSLPGGGSGFLSADQAAAARKVLGVRGREDIRRQRNSDLERRKQLRETGGGSLPGTHAGNHKAAYAEMKTREAAQQRLAQTNRARVNYGMKPIQ